MVQFFCETCLHIPVVFKNLCTITVGTEICFHALMVIKQLHLRHLRASIDVANRIPRVFWEHGDE